MENWTLVQHALDLRASIHHSLRPGRVITDMTAASLLAKANTVLELAREQKEESFLMASEIIELREQVAAMPMIKIAAGAPGGRPRLYLVSDNSNRDDDDGDGGSAA